MTEGLPASAEKVLRVVLRHVAIQPSGCWTWNGPRDIHGYGKVSHQGKTVGAHRWLWTQLRDPLSGEIELDHLCRNRACVNPEHLDPVTGSENVRRGHVARGSYECVRHGPKTRRRSGQLICRPCHAEKRREKRASAKASAQGPEVDPAQAAA